MMSRPLLVARSVRLAVFVLLGLVAPLSAAGPPRGEAITFSRHVAPILYKHCAGCHRPGEVGPFSLLNYKDAAKRAGFLKEVTATRRMPPWKPVPGYGDFQDARVLGAAEVETLARWAEGGARRGDPRDLPPLPRFTEGWQLGKPDLVLKMPEPFTIPAGVPDIYRCFVIPTGLKEERRVTAFEFRPGNRRVVHHALLVWDVTGTAREKDEEDPGPGFNSPGGSLGFADGGGIGGWAPGATPRHLPGGVGRTLPAGADVVMQIHYPTTGKEEKDQSTLGLYFARKKAGKILRIVQLYEPRLRIPAGAKRYRASARYRLPVDVHAIGILPHMHLLGRQMKVTATLPDGKNQPMIWIKDWDFNWQGQYQYKRPVRLPRGTLLEMEAFFDNSDKNPKNPNKPPQEVWRGGRTVDEMCECRVQVVVDRPGADEDRLVKDQARARRERVRRYMRWMEAQK
jgi:hypothetical protein